MIENLIWIALMAWWWRYAARAVEAQARWDAARQAERHLRAAPAAAKGGLAEWLDPHRLASVRDNLWQDRLRRLLSPDEIAEMNLRRRVPAEALACACYVIGVDGRIADWRIETDDPDLRREIIYLLESVSHD